MKVIVDTNVLVRAAVRDDARQTRVADKLLQSAELVAVSLPSLCEFVSVLSRGYKLDSTSIGHAIRLLFDASNVVMNRPAVEFGLSFLEGGGDFADGIMAYEGSWLGGETFVSFDRQAVKLANERGQLAQLLS
ncbi:type II toxin-antitoxin system VapC family toxin [Variovorax sp. dw_954]|uniref:type II toxin-antitoxin system VapC family toxin n=1 Tax=Variovorax sp. dw_954 TaxID=2720078 RepID=UPI001BD32F17|nr:type II toxin-antitoxin system VapC family toxin [Variovorax sp. dw_954]